MPASGDRAWPVPVMETSLRAGIGVRLFLSGIWQFVERCGPEWAGGFNRFRNRGAAEPPLAPNRAGPGEADTMGMESRPTNFAISIVWPLARLHNANYRKSLPTKV